MQILVPPASGSAVPNPRKLPNWNVENREGADPPFLWVGSLRVLAQVSVLPRANHRAQHLGPCHRVPHWPQLRLPPQTATIGCLGQWRPTICTAEIVRHKNWSAILNIPVPHPDVNTLVTNANPET